MDSRKYRSTVGVSSGDSKKGIDERRSRKRGEPSTPSTIGRERKRRHKSTRGHDYAQLKKELGDAKKRIQIICAENDDLRKKLTRAERRIKDFERNEETTSRKNEMDGIEIAKISIRASLENGDINKEDLLSHQKIEPSKRKGIRRAIFMTALGEIRQEIMAEVDKEKSAPEKDAVFRHDSRSLEVGVLDENADPIDLLDKLDRDLLAHIADVVRKCEESNTENVEIKPIYMSVKKIVFQGKENLMRCQRNTVRKMIDKEAKNKYEKSGAKASEVRTLLVERYMAEDAPHGDFETDFLDESVGNDVKTVVRMVVALHVLGLPGGSVGDVKSAAQKYHEFADYVANSDSNIEAKIVAKELKGIVDTRRDSRMELIYLKKLLQEIVAIGYQHKNGGNRLGPCSSLLLLGWK